MAAELRATGQAKMYDTARLTDGRHGYGWFGTEPAATLHTYERWAGAHPLKEGSR